MPTWAKIIAAIAVLGAAIGILTPTICGCGSDHDVNESSNLSQIAKSSLNFSNAGQNPRNISAQPGDTAHAAAFILAQNTGLNDAQIWFNWKDSLAPKKLPPAILVGGGDTPTTLNPAFAGATLSYEFAANLPTSAPSTTTPVVWTRGLRSDGTWAPDSPWHGQGGHIAFMDGHVEWFDKISTASDGEALLKYGTNEPTINIREALPPEAVILSAEPRKNGGK